MDDNERIELWRKRIHDYRESGLTMKAWSSEKGVPFNQLKYWMRKLSLGPHKRSSTTWVTVEPTPDPFPETAQLVVRIGGAVIDVHPGFDPNLLGQVVRALGAHL